MGNRQANSRRKGKDGERQCVHLLRSFGFDDARRTAQYRGNYVAGDVECPESLPDVHIEVKFGYPAIRVGHSILNNAIVQAMEDCQFTKVPIVLWKEKHGQNWKLTFPCGVWGFVTTEPTRDKLMLIDHSSRELLFALAKKITGALDAEGPEPADEGPAEGVRGSEGEPSGDSDGVGRSSTTVVATRQEPADSAGACGSSDAGEHEDQ